MPWQVFKDDFEKLTREFAERARLISQQANDASKHVTDGKVADYFQFVATGVAATAEAVEKSEVLSFEEWQKLIHGMPKFVMKLKDLGLNEAQVDELVKRELEDL